MSAIKQWLSEHKYRLTGQYDDGNCYDGPGGEFVVLSLGDGEPNYWRFFTAKNADGEHADQTGTWDEVPVC